MRILSDREILNVHVSIIVVVFHLDLNMAEGVMSIRLISSKNDPNAKELHRESKALGRCPISKDGIIFCLLDNVTENGTEYAFTLEIKK